MSSGNVKIGVKFCGKCNPHIDTGEIYRKIKNKLENIDGIQLVPKDTPGLNVLIVISGCPVDCAERPPGEFKEIVVAGETVDRVGCKGDMIAEKVINLLMV